MSKEHFVETLIPDVVASLERIEQALGVAAAGALQSSSNPSDPSFASRNVQPPSQFFLTQDFRVRVRSVTSRTNESLTITANILVADRIFPVSTATPTFTNTTNTTVLRVPVTGFLVYVSLQAAVATLRCETYAVVELLDQNGTFQSTLFAGYVTANKPLSYPPINVEDSFSGYGKLVMSDVAPVFYVGTITVPANRIYKPISGYFQVTTDAVVGNRLAFFMAFNTASARDQFTIASQGAATAAIIARFEFTVVGTSYTSISATPITYIESAMPESVLNAGDQARMILNYPVGAADNLPRMYFSFWEWLTL